MKALSLRSPAEAMRYLIDGYNLLHKLGLLPHKAGPHGLLHARRKLLDRLADGAGKEAETITVIFDGAGARPGLPDHEDYRQLHVRYATADTADGLIEELVHAESAPHTLTVISDDHRVRDAARRRGCIVIACLDFYDGLGKHAPDPEAPEPSLRPDHLSPEETQRWLEEFRAAGLTDPPDDGPI
jgi:predicted RNA-binding protein with PIN domain